MTRITRIVREHAGEVGELARLLQHRAETEADRAADGDDLGGHERPPRERPALLEAGEVAGQRGGEDHERGELRARRRRARCPRGAAAAAPGRRPR